MGLLQDKPPETEPEWSETLGAIEDVCEEKPNLDEPVVEKEALASFPLKLDKQTLR